MDAFLTAFVAIAFMILIVVYLWVIEIVGKRLIDYYFNKKGEFHASIIREVQTEIAGKATAGGAGQG
jgi:hypothetical protein